MKTLRSNNVESNIYGTTIKELEEGYLKKTKKYGVTHTKCVIVSKEKFLNSTFINGAVFGFDKNDNVVIANALSTYCGEEMIVMICAHKYDFLIDEAMVKLYNSKNGRKKKSNKTSSR